MDKPDFIAHIRDREPRFQSVEDHLLGTAKLSSKFAASIGMGKTGYILGLLHDVGKYGQDFQRYIRQGDSFIEQENASEENKYERGSIDHSTAGAQYILTNFKSSKTSELITKEILYLAICGHHGGLMDVVSTNGTDNLRKRLEKEYSKTSFNDVVKHLPCEIAEKIKLGFSESAGETSSFFKDLGKIVSSEGKDRCEERRSFYMGCLTKFLLSCLVDADRCDTINFCVSGAQEARDTAANVDWDMLYKRLIQYLFSIKQKNGENPMNRLNEIRGKISEEADESAQRGRGIFTFTVPTGGGKTLASLRFALRLALLSKKDKSPIQRIIYVLPYTTIIEQNAARVRDILEPEDERGRIILECHSNLAEEKETWIGNLLSENWDAPIIFTTSVQFLEALFSNSTKSARRLHQLADSIVIFDEIQTLPVKTVHLFCSAINFYVKKCGMTAVLCTATQPLLNKVPKEYGALDYDQSNEIIKDPGGLFKSMRRTKFINALRVGKGYSTDELGDFVFDKQEKFGSSLVIVNTTAFARDLYKTIKSKKSSVNVIHLSAMMCPEHRREVLSSIEKLLSDKVPLICVSTQVMEAGIDVDFASVIRSVAGFDSLAQAAGRCNREWGKTEAYLYIVNPAEENLSKLEEIKLGREKAKDVIHEAELQDPNGELFSISNIEKYFQLYFYARKEEMRYDVRRDRDDNILNMLSLNLNSWAEYKGDDRIKRKRILVQAFKEAGSAFKTIDAPTYGIIVPYKEGKILIEKLREVEDLTVIRKLLRKAQRYSVNLYPYIFKKLEQSGAIEAIKLCCGRLEAWGLQPEFYSSEFGISGNKEQNFKEMIV